MNIQKERESFEAWLFREYPTARDFVIVYRPDENIYEHCPTQARWEAWQAAKAQAVQQAKQDLIDRVNARWQLAHEECAENWNTYSSAQMDAFDWIEQDIEELFSEAQEQSHD